MAEKESHVALGVVSFGLAVGITSAVFVFLLGIVAALLGWGIELAQILASLYIGFGPTFAGTIAGAVWAFVDGLIAGMMIAWLYNKIVMRHGAHRRKSSP
jgi:fructose-specific phosphotransferase system IIC component